MPIRMMGMVGFGPIKTNESGHRITDGVSAHPMFREMTDVVRESDASEEAQKLGLTDMKFGRYGKDGHVTHVVDSSGKLVPKDQTAGGADPSPVARVARNDGESRKSRADRDSRLQSKPTMGLNPDDPYGDPLPPVTPGTPPKTTVAGQRGISAPAPGTAQDDDPIASIRYVPGQASARQKAAPTRTGSQYPIGSDEFWQDVESGVDGIRTADGEESGQFITLPDGRGATLEFHRSASGNPMSVDITAIDSDGNEIEWDTDVPLEGAEDAAGSEFGDDAEAWSRGQSPYGPDEGVSMPMFREMVSHTNKSVLRESPRSVLKKLVKEEYEKLLDEAQKEAPKIAKKLHEFREELFGSMLKRDGLKSSRPVLQRRIQLQTVSEAIEVPVNDLMLYFLNRVKATNEHHLIEYRLGCVTFFAN